MMVLQSEMGFEMEDEVSHDESTSDEESVDGGDNDQEEVDDNDEEVDDEENEREVESDQDADDDSSEEVVEIKGTKFNVSKAAKEALVNDDEDDSGDDEDDSGDDEEGDVEDADDEDQDSDVDDQDSDAENDEPKPADDDDDGSGKSGWADAMAKVLNMGKDSEQAPGLLSKAKLDNFQIKEKSADDGEGAEGQPRDSVKRLLKKELEEKGRFKPNIVRDRAREKMLSKLATRGVVQLFNAVKEQQKDLKSKLEEVGGSVRKREKVYKNIDKEGFLEVLSGSNKRKESTNEKVSSKKKAKVKAEEQDEEDTGGWSVIRDDYMLGAKMKDWDKESDEAEEA